VRSLAATHEETATLGVGISHRRQCTFLVPVLARFASYRYITRACIHGTTPRLVTVNSIEAVRDARDQLLRHVREILDRADEQNRRVTDDEAADLSLSLDFAADLLRQIRTVERDDAA
jgi:hypothetical protein